MSTTLPLDRRTLLRGVGLTALAIFGTSACASAVDEQKSEGSADATPVRGGTLKTAVTQDVVPANFLTNTAGATTVIGLAYESLIRYPHDELSPTPLLATSWELAPDGLSLTLQLRDDVTFHSGRPFTSADAEFSIRTYADPKWTAQLKSTAAAVTGFDTTDPHQIVLTFAHPLGNIFDLLDTVPILDSESIEQLATGEKFVGTGPFVLTSRTPNSSLIFERNEKYWVPERPYLDRVEVSIIPDSQALVNSLRANQVQAVTNINYRDAETLSKDGGHTTSNLEGAELQIYVGTNVQNPALADVRLRQAIAFALDRDRIIAEVFRGAGYPINVPWPKNSPAYDESLNSTFALDVDKARALVAEVGAIPSLPLTYQAGNPYYEATAQIVQANLADIGITVELDPVESAAFVKQLIGAQFQALWVTFHSWAQYIPSTLTVSAYPFNALKNASRYESPAYVAAADQAWQVADGTSDEAVEKYSGVSRELLDGLFLIEIGVVFNQIVSANSVHGIDWTKRSEILLTDTFLS
ncbi:ABC transporter substrate-binding protein [Rhodococcoides yunnanense]|uniref:ABC transporter substrate-binding protein n=1 Tax=Rhodococcoides yunnanense TaxID=278209 RepID=UPI000A66E396|nr:ABC transporter substrate-binding protein [Rhodococcus yunnanensis]